MYYIGNRQFWAHCSKRFQMRRQNTTSFKNCFWFRFVLIWKCFTHIFDRSNWRFPRPSQFPPTVLNDKFRAVTGQLTQAWNLFMCWMTPGWGGSTALSGLQLVHSPITCWRSPYEVTKTVLVPSTPRKETTSILLGQGTTVFYWRMYSFTNR